MRGTSRSVSMIRRGREVLKIKPKWRLQEERAWIRKDKLRGEGPKTAGSKLPRNKSPKGRVIALGRIGGGTKSSEKESESVTGKKRGDLRIRKHTKGGMFMKGLHLKGKNFIGEKENSTWSRQGNPETEEKCKGGL